ncbi:invasion associated locus B family protein [Rhizobiales bacterium]|uniref:invasion associated locus B family protein n=1 Tax=Hongsoonwoonella zoysiae TaxID=2821844 RepID=UPI00155FB1C7|nr:invasion associated locus B family protein [Hongsoonwoonella zoysiae]NRG16245.1 invasion associated locus B family protein [Hongsoonwoonella zoysiae]
MGIRKVNRKCSKKFFAVFTLGIICSFNSPQTTLAQGVANSAGAEGQVPGAAGANWVVNCSEASQGTGSRCRMAQNIVVQESGQRLLTVLIEQRPNSEQLALVLALPHGLFLPAGASLQVDEGDNIALPIQTSDAGGAYAGTAVSQDLIAAMKKGGTLKVSFQTAQRQPVTVPVTLIGFSAAYQKLAN